MVILLATGDDNRRAALADALNLEADRTVLTAADAPEMLAIAEADGWPDALVIDEAMYRAEAARIPDLPVHVLSGSAEAAGPVEAWLEEIAPVVAAGAGGNERLGDYELLEWLGRTGTTDIYRAVQRSVNREVTVERLKPELSGDGGAEAEFRRMVRARAAVTHPHIGPVFEAEESRGSLFFTRERLAGANLEELVASGERLSQPELLEVLRVAGEAFAWLGDRGIAHEAFRAGHVVLGPDGVPRVSNTACPGDPAPDEAAEIAGLADAVKALGADDPATAPEAARVAALMTAHGPHSATTWRALAREARAAQGRLLEARTTLPEAEPPEVRAAGGEWSRRLLTAAGILALAAVSWTVSAWAKRARRAAVRDLSAMVHIPAGPFAFGDGSSVNLPEFWIDRYEVSLARYAAFLDALPHGDPSRFDHPDQPTAKSGHIPPDWDRILTAARKAGTYRGQPITLNAPVFNVDWWDAWAFARWRGGRLPSDEEWEKAARGTDGRRFPWGDSPAPGRANTASPEDGFVSWCDVDALPEDVSPSGVAGMAGNVAEWTSTLAQHPDLPDVQVPVFRGASFQFPPSVPVSGHRYLARDALYTQPFLGFRTASSSPPPAP